jgi:hypothetical protein
MYSLEEGMESYMFREIDSWFFTDLKNSDLKNYYS